MKTIGQATSTILRKLQPANANSIRVFFGLDTLTFKFHHPSGGVSKVPPTEGGVVRFHRPTSLFFFVPSPLHTKPSTRSLWP